MKKRLELDGFISKIYFYRKQKLSQLIQNTIFFIKRANIYIFLSWLIYLALELNHWKGIFHSSFKQKKKEEEGIISSLSFPKRIML